MYLFILNIWSKQQFFSLILFYLPSRSDIFPVVVSKKLDSDYIMTLFHGNLWSLMDFKFKSLKLQSKDWDFFQGEFCGKNV
jgi:hypothetical protein